MRGHVLGLFMSSRTRVLKSPWDEWRPSLQGPGDFRSLIEFAHTRVFIADLCFKRVSGSSGSRPIRVFSFRPIRVFSSRPIRVFSSRPIRVFSSRPIRVFSSRSIRVFSSRPIRVFSSRPIWVFSSRPFRVFSSRPIRVFSCFFQWTLKPEASPKVVENYVRGAWSQSQ